MFRLLPLLLIAISLTACQAERPDFFEMAADTGSSPVTGEPLTVNTWENDNFILILEEDIAAIQLIDKSNGHVWSSRPLEPNFDNMSRDWQLFAGSMLVLDFINPGGNMLRTMYNPERADPPIYVAVENGFAASLHFPDADIRIGIFVTLTETGISVSVPDEHIEYLGLNVIGRLKVMPFFGASYQDELPGYIFIPDGSGALMRFAPSRPYGNSFVGRFYGEDRALVTSPPLTQAAARLSLPPVPMPQMYLPVFGVVQGENAFLAVIKSGDIFCEIEANPAGFRIDYFWVSTRFLYHELYWQPTGGLAGFITPSPVRNPVNARVDYHFLNGDEANYAGMANKYRQTLADKNWLVRRPPLEGQDIPIKLDVVMAERQQALMGSATLAMTQFSDIENWIDRLNADNVLNIIFSLMGVERGGISGRTTGNFRVEGSIGGQRGLSRLHQL